MRDLLALSNVFKYKLNMGTNRKFKLKGFFSVLAIGFLIYLFFKYPNSLGGSLTIVPLVAAFIILPAIIRNLTSEFRVFRSILIVIMVINFLTYWEVSGKDLSTIYLVILFGCLFVMVTLYLSVVSSLFFALEEKSSDSQNKPLKEVKRIVWLPIGYIGIVFSMFSGFLVYTIKVKHPLIYANHAFLRISYVMIGALLIFFLISLIYIRKVEDSVIQDFLVLTGDRFNMKQYNGDRIVKYFIVVFICFGTVGTLVEIGRGMWVIWIETLLLILLMNLITWKIYRKAFN